MSVPVCHHKMKGTAELSIDDTQSINELAISWDFPVVTPENRRWLLDKLLLHAVSIQ